uniref:SCP domain-containing protein n=1 Tax=Mesocestoides corti TaxID=53468 RepID=A0A5K3FGZ4_MESCO
MISVVHLLALVWCVLAEVPSDEERGDIIECHTRLRAEVQPPASNMLLMTYSTHLEQMATKFVSKCPPPNQDSGNDSPLQGVGVITSTDGRDEPNFITFACEVDERSYNYGDDTTGTESHDYRVMVTASTNKVGCAAQRCAHTSRSGQSYYYFLACLYQPSLPTLDGKPYEKGGSCTKCPNGYRCHQNQCYTNETTSVNEQQTIGEADNTNAISSIFSPLPLLMLALYLVHLVK